MKMRTPGHTALILGANGRFGAAATAAFARAGWQVLAQVRRRPAQVLPGVTPLEVPLEDPVALAAAVVDLHGSAAVVVHAVNPAYTDWARDALRLSRSGIEVARRLGALFMLPGNVYNFGSGQPEVLREDTAQLADTRKGRIRVAMEADLVELGRRGDLHSLVIRAGDFYGCGRGNWVDKVMLRDLPRGRLVYPGPLDRAHAWAYLPDLAQAFVAAAEAGGFTGHNPLHFAGHTLTGTQWLQCVEQAAASMGLAPARGWRHAGLPWGLMRLGAWFQPMLRELVEMAYLWEVPHGLDGQALQQRLGTLPVTPPEEAMRRTLIDLGFEAGRAAGHAPPKTRPAP